MYICSCRLCVQILHVYLLSISVYIYIYLEYEETDVGGYDFEVVSFDHVYPFF